MRGRRASWLVVLAVLTGCGAASHAKRATSLPSPKVVRIVTQSFAVFRRAARRGDQIPARLAGGRVAASLSRLVYSGSLGTMYAYAQNGDLCADYEYGDVQDQGGTSSGGNNACDPVTGASENVLDMSVGLQPRSIVALLVPDGVRTVTLIHKHGQATTASVTNNSFVFAGAGIVGWKLTTAHGVKRSGRVRAEPSPAGGASRAGLVSKATAAAGRQAQTCLVAAGFRVTGGAAPPGQASAPNYELIVGEPGLVSAFVALYNETRGGDRVAPGLVANARRFGGVVDHCGRVTVVWTHPPAPDTRIRLDRCVLR
jgi:hypothetical protein